MRTFTTIFFSLLCYLAVSQDTVVQRIWLVGDAGKLQNGKNPELEFIRSTNLLDAKTTVLYLGDNIYQTGLPDSFSTYYAAKKAIIDVQIDLVRNTLARGFVIPGNHDWQEGRANGWEQIKRQDKYIESLGQQNIRMLPSDGCPGPEEVILDSNTVLLIMDTQWWLHQNDKPGQSSDCECKNEEEVLTRLSDLVYRHRNKIIFFASHHPFYTYGPHGGYFTFKQHLFPLTDFNEKLYVPLPVIGSVYPVLRQTFGHIQDKKHPIYKSMVDRIDEILLRHPYCIRVAGHEHTLQHIQIKGNDYIVSGAGSKTSQVKKGNGSLFADKGQGVGLLEIYGSGKLSLQFFTSKSGTKPIYDTVLRTFTLLKIQEELSQVQSFPDSMTHIAAPQFKAGKFKRWLWGSNYRDEWTSVVKAPVFDISKERGGLKTVSRGGRLQSMSLRLEDSSGQQYVLRSIEKYPERILPEELRGTFIKDALVDAISSSYPYAALSVPIMATAAGIPHATPKLVYVTNDPRLGVYKDDFKNGLYIFEEREPGDIKKTYSTPKLLEDLQEDNDNKVDDKEVLQARLLDMFMMDFDRHEDQWRWGRRDNGKGKTYYAIPRDRDQPFFINRGVLPYIISRSFLQPRFQGFRAQAERMSTFNFNGRFFDRLFLNGLSRSDWEKATDAFIPLMTDSVIETALHQQPVSIQSYSTDFIIKTLKQRRNFLKSDVLDYYKFLAKRVDVYGSDKRELFDVFRDIDGSVLISVYKLNKEREKGELLYQRKFIKDETKEIRLWGMGSKDRFQFSGDARRSILVRVIGGQAGDSISVETPHLAAIKTRIYDLQSEKNSVSGTGKWLARFSKNSEVHQVDRHAYKYNILMPLLSVAFNLDDGLFLGAGFKYTGHGFRKQPYKVQHQLKANYAFATGAYNFLYNVDAVDVIGNADLVGSVNIKAPNNTSNFFGLGNQSEFELSNGRKLRYYRSRYNISEGSLMLRFNSGSKVSLLAGPVVQLYHVDSNRNVGRILSENNIPGIDRKTVYDNHSYVGGRIQLDIDTRNNKLIPSRGLYWHSYFQSAAGINDQSKNITQLNSELSVFTSFSKAANFVIGAKIGAGFNFGSYEFFQAQYLGSHDNLRGFRRYRFGGDRMLYSNIDFRLHLFDFRGYLLPGSIGILGFNDIGRVWVKGEESSRWHHGYGGGLWLSPAKRFVLAACYAYSKEGGMPLVSFGFQF